MPKELYINRVKEFKEYVLQNHILPKVWKTRFSDGEDMRLWFNKISKSARFKTFIFEINDLLKKYNSKILNDNEKEQKFLEYISNNNQIPLYNCK